MCLHRLLGWAKVFVFVGWVDRMGSQNFRMGLKFYEKQNVHALTWIKFLKIFVSIYVFWKYIIPKRNRSKFKLNFLDFPTLKFWPHPFLQNLKIKGELGVF